MNRADELDAFKQLNLSLIASSFGYELDRKKSTRHSVLMKSGGDKIIIAKNGSHYVYCSVHNSYSSGTVIDLVQRSVEPGCSLGRVRQVLRPFLGGGALLEVEKRLQGSFATEIKASEPDLLGVAARYAQLEPVTGEHPYLCQTRAIPAELLVSGRLIGRIRMCPKRGSIAFPHWGTPLSSDSDERCLTGYEIKGQGINMFSKGGRKSLWMSAGLPQDRRLAFSESALDAISYFALHANNDDLRVASISGQLNPDQPALIRSAITRMPTGSQVIAAFDNDDAGDRLTDSLHQQVEQAGRGDITFRDHRPARRGADWNAMILEKRGMECLIAPENHI